MLNVKEAGAQKSKVLFKTLSNLLDFHTTQQMLDNHLHVITTFVSFV